MISRPATSEDLPDIARLAAAVETHWFGAPEGSESELREGFQRVAAETDSLVVVDDGRIAAAGWFVGEDTMNLIHPAAGTGVTDAVIDWFASRGGRPPIHALAANDAFLASLTAAGFAHTHSAFELIRAVDSTWVLEPPEWPTPIRLSGLEFPERVHELIYRRARWSDVPGHPERSFDDWRGIFFPESVTAEQQVLAWQGDELVGVAIGRIFSDGAGWISQLAVPVEHRGRGLGRALLLAALHRHVADGATRLGLQVSAKNRDAIRLYLGVGLRVDREWQEFRIGNR